jgi:hypothetical protein
MMVVISELGLSTPAMFVAGMTLTAQSPATPESNTR